MALNFENTRYEGVKNGYFIGEEFVFSGYIPGALIANGTIEAVGDTITVSWRDGAQIRTVAATVYDNVDGILLRDVDYGAYFYLGDASAYEAAGRITFTNLTLGDYALPPPNSAPAGRPEIGGIAAKGALLTVSAGTLADADGLGELSYQWQRGDGQGGFSDITGATGTTYLQTQQDVGLALRVVVSYLDGHGAAESVHSDATGLVAAVNTAPTGSVTIGGKLMVGEVLTAYGATVADADGLGLFTYQWQRLSADGEWNDIEGARGVDYTTAAADLGHRLQVVLRFTDAGGTDEQLVSAATYRINDAAPMVDDAAYYASNPDVAAAGMDAAEHYALYGWREGRDPNEDFSTNGYLSANADVRAAGLNPLEHYLRAGWLEGRDPSADFDTQGYLARNPDVAAAGLNPLLHYLSYGADEGRVATPAVGRVGPDGFDAEYYLLANPDIGLAGADAAAHWAGGGWLEGRNPNAYFNAVEYLAINPDVAAVGMDPLRHYMNHGWIEGRGASAFNAAAYLAANPDVAAAGVNPLGHYLQYGAAEGRPLGAETLLD